MVDILYDLSVINAAKSTNPAILEEYGVEAMPYIYDKYGVDSITFVNSDTYYASRPQDYEDIYSRVEARLEKEKEILEEKRREESEVTRKEAEAKRVANARNRSDD